jgi:hypothetical protein
MQGVGAEYLLSSGNERWGRHGHTEGGRGVSCMGSAWTRAWVSRWRAKLSRPEGDGQATNLLQDTRNCMVQGTKSGLQSHPARSPPRLLPPPCRHHLQHLGGR